MTIIVDILATLGLISVVTMISVVILLCTTASEIPIYNDLFIPDGATNGEALKLLYPRLKDWGTDVNNRTHFIEINGNGNIISFKESWWNAPYKGK